MLWTRVWIHALSDCPSNAHASRKQASSTRFCRTLALAHWISGSWHSQGMTGIWIGMTGLGYLDWDAWIGDPARSQFAAVDHRTNLVVCQRHRQHGIAAVDRAVGLLPVVSLGDIVHHCRVFAKSNDERLVEEVGAYRWPVCGRL
eukprot:5905033-Prymnesium_polylepis.1